MVKERKVGHKLNIRGLDMMQFSAKEGQGFQRRLEAKITVWWG